jgi:hypothetical protein
MSVNTLIAFLVGLLIGMYVYGKPPTYLKNAMYQNGGAGETYVLSKWGSGQVAVIHGFLDNEMACLEYKKIEESIGGVYSCYPTSTVAPIN